jgi:hypothetical protein
MQLIELTSACESRFLVVILKGSLSVLKVSVLLNEAELYKCVQRYVAAPNVTGISNISSKCMK